MSSHKSKNGKRKAGDGDSSDEDMDMLDVDFEWFDPQEIDFHGLKTLLRQLFDVDNELLDLSALANLILSQPLLGSTVKVSDGDNETNQTDPYAFLTVLNLHEHRDNPAIRTLTKYLSSKTPASSPLSTLLAPASTAQVGLILTERFINMPAEIVPPMYKMLQEEISWALEEKEPYAFSHYLVLSKTYTETESQLDGETVVHEGEEDVPPSKKAKSKSGKGGRKGASSETFFFHPEDEILQQHALWHAGFEYTKQGGAGASDAKRTFQELGIRPQGFLVLIEGEKFKGAVEGMEAAFKAG